MSDIVAFATNVWLAPLATDADVGVTASAVATAAVTVIVVDPLTPPEVAVMVAEPGATAVAIPELLIVATDAGVADHVTDVIACLLPSLYVPVALNCCVFPAATDGVAGVTAIDVRTGVGLVDEEDPVFCEPPQAIRSAAISNKNAIRYPHNPRLFFMALFSFWNTAGS